MRARFQQARNGAAWAALIALLALVGLSGFAHTDDGCAVEVHCQACRFALNPTVGAPALTAAAPLPAPAETVEAEEERPPALPAGRPLAARGPPAA